MRAIGGYFSLERSTNGTTIPALQGRLLNTGRNSLEYICRATRGMRRLLIPYFTCDTVMEPIVKTGLDYACYHIGASGELDEEVVLQEGDYLLYTNYFGIKDGYVEQLAERYGERLIVDQAQALYAPPTLRCAYSPRKFVGLPDGGMAFCPERLEGLEKDCSYDRCSHLLKRVDCGAEAGYADFRDNSRKLKGLPIREMSALTQVMMAGMDWTAIRERRRANFAILHEALAESNELKLPAMDSFACPMVYPYLVKDEGLRKALIAKRVFVATYWPNVLVDCSEETLEYQWAKYILPLPIDQRYGREEMEYMVTLIRAYLQK